MFGFNSNNSYEPPPKVERPKPKKRKGLTGGGGGLFGKKKIEAKKADTNLEDFMKEMPPSININKSDAVQKTINEGKLKQNEFLIDGVKPKEYQAQPQNQMIENFMDMDSNVKVSIRKPKTEGTFNLRFVVPKKMGQDEKIVDVDEVEAPLNYKQLL